MADSSDPFEILKQQEAGVPGTPLPAAEVRARGDRMRRRRTAFRAVAAAAAVAVVTTGGVALGGDLTTGPAPLPPTTQSPEPQPPEPSPSAEPSRATDEPFAWTTEIPDGFPLAAGWPDVAATGDDSDRLTGPGHGLDPMALDACGRTVPDPASTDRINAVWRNVVTALSRELRVFPSDQEAVTYLAHLRNLWQQCDPEEAEDGLLTVVRPTSLGEESFALVTGLQLDQDTAVSLGVVQVVRVGNAVFADEIGTEGGQPGMGDELTGVLADMAKDSAAVVEAMEQFRAASAPTDDVSATPDPNPRVDIPAGFPLDLGYPEDEFDETELVGPGPEVEVFDRLEACGSAVSPRQTGVDRLGVSFTQPEDTRLRLLTTYASVEAAERALAEYARMYQDCPRQEHEFGGATLTQVRKIQPGDQGYVAIRTFEQHEGLPTLGLEVLYLVRVGNAVLLLSTSNEGGGNEKQIYAYVREQTALAADLAEEMCIFSGGGCSE